MKVTPKAIQISVTTLFDSDEAEYEYLKDQDRSRQDSVVEQEGADGS